MPALLLVVDVRWVAANAGFVLSGTVTQVVPRTGETFEDLRYVLELETDS